MAEQDVRWGVYEEFLAHTMDGCDDEDAAIALAFVAWNSWVRIFATAS